MEQLALFAGLGPEPAGVAPAEADGALRELGARLPSDRYLGTSSWSFPGWQGLVYRGQHDERQLAREGLAAYARHPLLRTVGLDRTYYAPIPEEAYRSYARQVPAEFRFLVKASQELTTPEDRHGRANPRFLEPGWATDAVIGPTCAGLGARLGPLVFQFPPLDVGLLGGARAFLERLGRFLAALPPGPLYAVELRNHGLLGPRALEALGERAAHCLTVHPSMPPLLRQAELMAPALERARVCRWMLGHGQRYAAARERYAPFDRLVDPDPDSRQELVQLLRGWAGPAWVVVNNKAEGSAPRSVRALAEALLGE